MRQFVAELIVFVSPLFTEIAQLSVALTFSGIDAIATAPNSAKINFFTSLAPTKLIYDYIISKIAQKVKGQACSAMMF